MPLQELVEMDALTGRPIYLAGQRVMPGRYRQLETGREIVLDQEDRLPASLDGRVACYIWLGPRPAAFEASRANSAQSASPRPQATRAVSRL